MGAFSDEHPETTSFNSFATYWFKTLLAVFLRSVRSPALAYDLATETLAAAHWQWEVEPEGDDAAAWLVRIGARVLEATVARGQVPSTERRRAHVSATRRLSVVEQHEIAALAEHHIEIPPAARDAADELARTAPPPHILKELRLSTLVDAAALPDRECDPNGA